MRTNFNSINALNITVGIVQELNFVFNSKHQFSYRTEMLIDACYLITNNLSNVRKEYVFYRQLCIANVFLLFQHNEHIGKFSKIDIANQIWFCDTRTCITPQ